MADKYRSRTAELLKKAEEELSNNPKNALQNLVQAHKLLSEAPAQRGILYSEIIPIKLL